MPRAITVTYSVWPKPDAVAQAAAHLFTEAAMKAAEVRGVARIAISGGSTPKRMFALLADPVQPFHAQVPWDKLKLYWVDERCVPPTDSESNYRMTHEAMLDHVPLPPESVFRMEGELDPEEAANRYETFLRNSMRLEGAELPTFDLVLLGMGDDGHTASLFPHTGAINELGRLVVANHVPQKDTWRITLTWPVINQGREVAFLIEGASKATALAEVLLGPRDPERLPSQLIRPANGSLSFLLDQAAAAQLPPPVSFTTPDGTGKVGTLELSR
jgi:6-phosphogluconolactonase